MSSFTDEAAPSAPASILVSGGAGYIGCVLVPKLLALGYRVTAYDLMLFGSAGLARHPNLRVVQGDIRDRAEMARLLRGQHAVIHLAAIANDACFELAPQLARSINHDCFQGLVLAARHAGVQRFLFVSDASVYGRCEQHESATEAHRLAAASDLSKYKALCESILLAQQGPEFTTTIVRPGLVFGPSPRMRFDLLINGLINQACHERKLTILGGSQFRASIHVDDLADLCGVLLRAEPEHIAGETFNAVGENHTILELARVVRNVVAAIFPGPESIEVATQPTRDAPSYRVSGQKLTDRLGFVARRTVEEATHELCAAFAAGRYPDSLTGVQYDNAASLRAKRAA
ncbi:MAG: NAD-dependent epimerase/dehydratase family protein [Gemmataceae bacterium]